MNNLPRHTLLRIIAEHGRGICDAPKRVEALLRDLCGEHRREINIIIGALEERVASDLMAAGKSVPRDVLLARLAARLRDNLALTPEAALWAVETWAVALGIVSEAELPAQTRAKSSEAGRSDAPPSPVVRDSKPSAANPATLSPPAPQPQRRTTHHAPVQQPSPTPKPNIQPPPPIVGTPAPSTRRTPPPLPTSIAVPEPPQQNVSPSLPSRQTSRRGLKLRSCLIVVVLAVVLFVAAVFVVPAVIMLLREEQARPSINEPRVR